MEQSGTNSKRGEQAIERSGIVRFVLHVMIGIAGWTAFGYFWFVVIRRGVGSRVPVSIIAMAIFMILLVALTSLWVKHNIRISKRNRRRSTGGISKQAYTLDKAGAEVEIEDIEALKNSALIEITVAENRKVFKSLTVQ